ncbi:MAG: hypothetical protein Q7U70_05720 [Methylotenera sp.]|nr:hypothetical protein [Methylotenera sp.]MDO9479800.1 hypothetical protein [Hydrogenophaga sp.]
MAMGSTEITKELFGGVLDVDGAGFYPGLELLNLVLCSEGAILPSEDSFTLTRYAHDFARRLLQDENLPEIEKRKVLIDASSEDAVRRLLHCLELDVKNVVKVKSWEKTHFFPFTRSLVHWDARFKGGAVNKSISLERRYLRGGGALAFHILRKDSSSERLQKIRDGFISLFPEGESTPLESLASTLRNQGHKDAKPVKDTIEPESKLFNDDLEDLYRDGVMNILSHTELPSVSRIRSIISWTGIWIVIMQNSRSSDALGQKREGLIFDCAGVHGQLRRASQRCLKDAINRVFAAASKVALEQASKAVSKPASKQQLGKVRGSFAATAAAVSLLNSWKGRRHLVMGLDALETLVLACIEAEEEISFERFCMEWLYGKCGFITGRESAQEADLLNNFDASIFEENERRLAEQMKATGLLTVYSDATRMISTGSLR